MYSGSSARLGSERDAAPLVGADLVLVDDPFQGGAVAEAVVEGFGRDCGERQRGVHRQAELSGMPGVSMKSRSPSSMPRRRRILEISDSLFSTVSLLLC